MFHIKKWRHHALCLASVCLPHWAAAQTAPSAPPPSPRLSAEAFFQQPLFSNAVLSPDGQKVAFKLREPQTPAKLVVLDLATQKPTVVA
ncbi:MAG: hypothetical protein RL084_2025, partial [Pseudomonadota bacterium]